MRSNVKRVLLSPTNVCVKAVTGLISKQLKNLLYKELCFKVNSSPGFLISTHKFFRQKSGSVKNVTEHREGRKHLHFDSRSAGPGHGYVSI